jgi:hypothetical protein
MNLKVKSGDKLAVGRHAVAIHLPKGRGRVAVLTIPRALSGKVRVIRKRSNSESQKSVVSR